MPPEAYERALEINAGRGGGQQPRVDLCRGGRESRSRVTTRQDRQGRSPRQSQVADTLGWISHRKGLGGLAIRELQEAVDREPGNPMYHYHLGMVYAANGDREQAKRSLETALRLKPDFDGAQEASRVLSTL